MEKQYRIRKSTYFDEYGKEKREYYYIQQLKKFLWREYWSDIKHTVGGMGGNYKKTTEFNSYFDAYEFTVRLKTGALTDKWKEETIEHV